MRRLKLARDVFRETLRLYPPVSFMSRDATEPTTMRDKEIKPGEMIFLSPWLIQRHVTLWDRPDVFDPDRFSDPASKESQRSAHFPFSAGPHVCLGASFAMQEGILILACLARHFRFEALPNHTPRPLARLTLRSENGGGCACIGATLRNQPTAPYQMTAARKRSVARSTTDRRQQTSG
jgi:cytochrome P450